MGPPVRASGLSNLSGPALHSEGAILWGRRLAGKREIGTLARGEKTPVKPGAH